MTVPVRVVLCVALGLLAAACSDTSSLADGDGGERTIPPTPDALAFRSGRPAIDIVAPVGGERVESPVRFRVEPENLELRPAGQTVDGEGHLHLLIDQPCLEPGTEIPKNARLIHLGDGSNRAEIDLPPGRHEVCIQVGDGFHVAVAITDTVEFIVE